MTISTKRALISVFNKEGLVALAQGLADQGVELISTGSTAQQIAEAGIKVTKVEDVTSFPEMMDGRVKTLHPKIHGAILADRDKESHLKAMEDNGIAGIDLVVVNLYPFSETIADESKSIAECVEMIDIGGPAMVRSAAKNHAHVAVVTDPEEYPALLAEIVATGGTSLETRRRLATTAFAHSAEYDRVVSSWFAAQEATNWGKDGRQESSSSDDKYQIEKEEKSGGGCGCGCGHKAPTFENELRVTGLLKETLRYGENPHQKAAWYDAAEKWGLGSVEVLGGKELSYNNLIDTDAALQLVLDFAKPAVAIIKHTNPAGVAVAETIDKAYPKALAGDPVSAFGGIVAANRPINEATAKQIVEVFTEVVIAPGFSQAALQVLKTKKNLRILDVTNPVRPEGETVLRSIAGGMLVQEVDNPVLDTSEWRCVTTAEVSEEELAELAFAWQVCKHVKSNAIVLTKDNAVVGVGAGQMSRVDSVKIAVQKSSGRSEGAVLASDAFFPFSDGVQAAIDAGVKAIIQPGGSKRDEEVIATVNEANIPMIFTGRRHFRH